MQRSSLTNDGILAVWNDCAPGHEDEYEAWYQSEHLPERVAVPGFIRGRRYLAISAAYQFFTYYEVDSPKILTSQAYRSRLDSPTEATRKIMSGIFVNMTRSICRCQLRVGQFRGAVALTVNGISESDARSLIDERQNHPAMARAEFWQAVPDTDQQSAEEKLRGSDRRIDSCLFVEALRANDLSRWASEIESAVSLPVMTYTLLAEMTARE